MDFGLGLYYLLVWFIIVLYFGFGVVSSKLTRLQVSDEKIEDTDQEMYTGDEESYGLDDTELVTPSINIVRNQLPRVNRRNDRDDYDILRVIVDALQIVVGTIPAMTSALVQRRAR